MKLICLGTGTSVGVPVIGCDCAVCLSGDPRNRRRRTSLYLEAGGFHIVVDTPPDFREQVLEFKVSRVDAVLYTHSHADHIFGLDDMRRFNTMQDCVIPAYGSASTLGDLKRIFDYVDETRKMPGLYRPRIDFREIRGELDLGPVHVVPLKVVHGPDPPLGFLFESEGRTCGFVPDCREMSDDVAKRLAGVDIMILDALRHRPHKTHMTVAESVELLKRINAKRSYIIHLCHDLDHEETQKSLPDPIMVSYDGLTVEW